MSGRARGRRPPAVLAAETAAGYAVSWRRWERWCAAMELSPLPAEGAAVALYMAELARHTVCGKLALNALCAINRRHRDRGVVAEAFTLF